MYFARPSDSKLILHRCGQLVAHPIMHDGHNAYELIQGCCLQMAVMFMKIDTNCDGTVDWVSGIGRNPALHPG